MIEGTYDLRAMRQKWEGYSEMMKEGDGDGSLIGRSFIIAKSACTDILELLDVMDGALETTDD